MDPSEFRPSQRRQLQGPRPAPLRVSKDSYKIKKRPVAPSHQHHHPAELPLRSPPPQQQHHHHHYQDPVVIYAVSPKIIHAEPSDFMTLVQRLTGLNPSAVDASSADHSLPSPGGALSPAAGIALFEKAAMSPPHAPDGKRVRPSIVEQLEIEGGPTVDWPASLPGILSPMPASLPPISPNMFSPLFDPSLLGFLHELSPGFANNNNIGNNRSSLDGVTFLASPSNIFLSTPTVPSPGAFWDLLSYFPDL